MSYRRAAERPPETFRPLTEQAGHRFDGIVEVEPALMTEHVQQQDMPAWDTHRIVASRTDHLAWMHRHWAAVTLSGEELLAELGPDDSAVPTATDLTPTAEPTSETRS